MAGNLDKSLNDIIKRGRGNYGPSRKGSRVTQRSIPYSSSKTKPTQLFVGNLPWSIKWMDLKDMCKKYGDVKRADIAEDERGRSKGFGIVIFSDATGAEACISGLHGEIVEGRDLTVKLDDKPELAQRLREQSRKPRQQFNNRGQHNNRGQFNNGGSSMMFGNHVLSSPMNMGMMNGTGGGMGQFGGGGKFGSGVNLGGGGMQFGQHVLTAPGGGGGKFGGGGMQFGQHVLTDGGSMGGFGGRSGGGSMVFGGRSGGGGSSSSVFVGNLAWSVKWQDLKDLCRAFGNVVRADVEENEEGKSKGYGIVQFGSPMEAQNCVASLHGQIYNGRDLTVNLDKFNGLAKGKGPVRVYVGNLPWAFKKWQDLKDLCRNFGDVVRADIEEEEGGRSKGYGIVTFSSAFGAQNCIQNLNGQILNGRDLRVRLDRSKAPVTTGGKAKAPIKKKEQTGNWNDDVPDQAALDAEMDDYNKSKGE